MRLKLNVIRDFDNFSRLVRRAMDTARTYGQSTLTLKFTSTNESRSFDVYSEITKPEIKAEEPDLAPVVFPVEENTLKSKEKGEVSKSKRVIVQANDKTVDFTYVLDNMGLMPDIMPIGDLIYDARIYRSLKRSKINTVGDLKERLLDSISDERYSAFGYPLFTIRNFGICSAQKVLAIMTETIDAIKACHTTNSLTPEHPLGSKEKCVLEYIDKFDKMLVESLELSNRVNTCVCRWLYRYLGHYTDCVISDLKPLIEEQSWKSVRTFGIKAYEELIDTLYLKVVNSGAWILE